MTYLRNLLAGLVLAVTAAVPAAAAVAVTTPADGATVGRTFVLSGTAAPSAAIGLTIDGRAYIPPAERGRSGGEGSGTGQADAQGRFSIPIDLNGEAATNDVSGETVRSSGVADGRHTFEVQEFFYNGQSGQPSMARLTLEVRSAAGAPLAPVTPKQPAAGAVTPQTPIPTATPTPSPAAEPATVAGSQSERGGVPPLLLLAILTLLGLAAVAAAHRFSPGSPKSPK